MKRYNNGKHRAGWRRFGQRRLSFEALEARRVLDASFGFVPVAGGFVFQITGTDYFANNDTLAKPDNIVIWTDLGTGGFGNAATNYFAEWVDDGGTWHSLSGSVTAGDIADEAQDLGLLPGDFAGFHIKAMGGDDLIHANGAPGEATPASTDPAVAMIGIYDSAPIEKQVIYAPLIGQRLIVDGNGGNDWIYGSPEDDIIRGGPDKDQIWAGPGNDTVFGGTGDDQIWGGSGNDKLEGDDGRDRIHGEEGDDTIAGGPGDDGVLSSAGSNAMPGWGLFGGPGNDTIDGGDGADDLSGDEGSDKLIGGAGDDSLRGDHLDKNPVGGAGTDAWQAGPTTLTEAPNQDTDSSKHVGIHIEDGTLEKVDTTGKDANEPTLRVSTTVGGVSMVVIRTDVGGPFGDSAGQPYSFPDHIDLSAWTSDGTSGVQISTGGGNDFLAGSDFGRDWLDGGSGDDTIIGGGQSDYINAGAGNDLISGGAGADVIDGGTGEDTVTYNEVVVDSKVFPGSPAAVFVSLFGYGAGGDASGDRLLNLENAIGSEFNDTLSGNSLGNKIDGRGGNDRIFGGFGDDELRGGDGDDIVQGGAGDDVIFGGKGDDDLFGDSGSDKLLGDAGDDYLDGGKLESDDLSGGKGNDILVTEFRFGELADSFIFGNEGEDFFQILDASTANDQFLVMSELAERETLGTSDFENNEDSLDFVGQTINQAPQIVSTPVETAQVDTPYVYNVVAVDPDIGEVLVYALEEAPAGMSIDSTTGFIQWVPTSSNVGSHAVRVRVTDSGGLFDTQAYTLTVSG